MRRPAPLLPLLPAPAWLLLLIPPASSLGLTLRWADGSGCANLFNGYCPFHRFAVFLYEDYKPMADAHPCPAGACPHRQPRALWMYETQRLLYNDTARKHDYC